MTHKSSLKLALFTGAVLALAACATPAKTTTQTTTVEKTQVVTAQSSAKTVSADNDQVCKRQTVVGSNFKRKVCMTRAQWDRMEEDGRRTAGDIQRSAGPGVTN